jgi:hypothetical protein
MRRDCIDNDADATLPDGVDGTCRIRQGTLLSNKGGRGTMDPPHRWLTAPSPKMHTASRRTLWASQSSLPYPEQTIKIQGQNQRSSTADDETPLLQVQDSRNTKQANSNSCTLKQIEGLASEPSAVRGRVASLDSYIQTWRPLWIGKPTNLNIKRLCNSWIFHRGSRQVSINQATPYDSQNSVAWLLGNYATNRRSLPYSAKGQAC